MAFITDTPRASVFGGISKFFSAMGDHWVRAMNANARVAELERLSAKSDEELAKMGLKRQDIARYVFREIYFI